MYGTTQTRWPARGLYQLTNVIPAQHESKDHKIKEDLTESLLETPSISHTLHSSIASLSVAQVGQGLL